MIKHTVFVVQVEDHVNRINVALLSSASFAEASNYAKTLKLKAEAENEELKVWIEMKDSKTF